MELRVGARLSGNDLRCCVAAAFVFSGRCQEQGLRGRFLALNFSGAKLHAEARELFVQIDDEGGGIAVHYDSDCDSLDAGSSTTANEAGDKQYQERDKADFGGECGDTTGQAETEPGCCERDHEE
jgi:hypothetical protein